MTKPQLIKSGLVSANARKVDIGTEMENTYDDNLYEEVKELTKPPLKGETIGN